MRLKNKIALITGAARGIGLKTAEIMLKEGAKVIMTDIREELGAEQAKKLGCNFYKLDVRLEKDWEIMMSIIEKEYGRLDVLFNNAGATGFENGPQDPEHMTLSGWHSTIATNLDGVFLGCKYAIGLMKKNKSGVESGSIINMSSRSGIVGVPGASAYAAAKAAALNHTKSVALYCASQGYRIRCNAVCPAAIITPMWDDMLKVGVDRKEAIATLAKDIPLGFMGDPEDVAHAVAFLASEDARYITGTDITIDGGILAGTKAHPAHAHETQQETK